MLRGRRYNRAKKVQGGTGANQHTQQSGQSDHSASTAEKLAAEHGVSEKTIRRDGKLKGARLSGREQPDVTWQQHEIRWVRLYRVLQEQFGIRVR